MEIVLIEVVDVNHFLLSRYFLGIVSVAVDKSWWRVVTFNAACYLISQN